MMTKCIKCQLKFRHANDTQTHIRKDKKIHAFFFHTNSTAVGQAARNSGTRMGVRRVGECTRILMQSNWKLLSILDYPFVSRARIPTVSVWVCECVIKIQYDFRASHVWCVDVSRCASEMMAPHNDVDNGKSISTINKRFYCDDKAKMCVFDVCARVCVWMSKQQHIGILTAQNCTHSNNTNQTSFE